MQKSTWKKIALFGLLGTAVATVALIKVHNDYEELLDTANELSESAGKFEAIADSYEKPEIE